VVSEIPEHASSGVGRYEILREIGHGGMAKVYLARQTDLGRLVALKELSALSAADASAARRFVRESRLAGSLNHPNIVTVHDFFEDHATPYIAMEYLEHGSLRPVIGDLTFAQIAGVIESVLAGLGHAHDRGIVHRDVKPENLMISGEYRLKIADFGIAKATDETRAGTLLTATGTTIGTPMYMAPEQAMAQDVGPWTDLYAVGMIAFELLAGRAPFDTTGSPMAILLRHVNEPPLLLSSLEPSVDPRLSDWIDQLLATDPEDRTQNAAAAWLAFEEIVLDQLGSRWRRDARLGEVTPGPAAPGPRTPATMPMARAGTDPRAIPTAMPRAAPALGARAATPSRRRPARRLARSLLLVMALAVAVAAALAMAPGNGSSPSGGSPTTSPATSGASTAPPRASKEHPRSTSRRTPSGVGDSLSDDPSDDEEDGPEP
jgi:hypothetical protein